MLASTCSTRLIDNDCHLLLAFIIGIYYSHFTLTLSFLFPPPPFLPLSLLSPLLLELVMIH